MIDKKDYEDALNIVNTYKEQLNSEFIKDYTCCICREQTISQLEGRFTDPLKQEQGMWDGGSVDTLTFGYGSANDMNSYYIAICDGCIGELEEEGLAIDRKKLRMNVRK